MRSVRLQAAAGARPAPTTGVPHSPSTCTGSTARAAPYAGHHATGTPPARPHQRSGMPSSRTSVRCASRALAGAVPPPGALGDEQPRDLVGARGRAGAATPRGSPGAEPADGEHDEPGVDERRARAAATARRARRRAGWRPATRGGDRPPPATARGAAAPSPRRAARRPARRSRPRPRRSARGRRSSRRPRSAGRRRRRAWRGPTWSRRRAAPRGSQPGRPGRHQHAEGDEARRHDAARVGDALLGEPADGLLDRVVAVAQQPADQPGADEGARVRRRPASSVRRTRRA